MQAELPPPNAPLNGGATPDAPNANPGVASLAALFAASPFLSSPPSPAYLALQDLGGVPLPSPPSTGPPRAAEKATLNAGPLPDDVVKLLTGTHPNPEAVSPLSAENAAILDELELGAKLIRSHTQRGNLALEACRLHAMHKAATGQDLFPQERFDAYMDLVDEIIHPKNGTFDVIIPADPLHAAPPEDAAASSTSEDEDEDEDGEDEDNTDEDQQV